MNIFAKAAAALLILSVPAAPAFAQEQPITLAGDVMAVKITTDAAGTESRELVEPDVIVPGDRLIFGTDYTNTGAETVTDFVVTNPLPSAVRLAADADASLVVSVDGGTSWGILSSLSATSEDGTSRAATHSDVTHVRWTLASVPPGETGRLEYPAIIR